MNSIGTLTAAQIINFVCRDWRDSFMLPNYTPRGWWECDVFEVTKAGYFREYEVKVSRSDFFADANKGTTRREFISGDPSCVHEMEAIGNGRQCAKCGLGYRDRLIEAKHDLIDARSTRGPSRFWYVTPPALVTVAEVPTWSGLIEVGVRGSRRVKDAPKIHGEKIDRQITEHARGVCYYRMHELRRAK